MRYMGSKNRISKYILPIMLKDRTEGQYWVEPFVGGANMIDKVEGKRLGSDINPYLISALEFIKEGNIPRSEEDFSEEDYKLCLNYIRSGESDEKPPFQKGLIGYALFAFSFGGKFTGGWWRGGNNSKGVKRDGVAEQYRSNTLQKEALKGVELQCCNYLNLKIPEGSIIYCDPPYKGTTGYKDNFDHSKFWRWCKRKSKQGHKVYVSEYNAPDGFECIWQQDSTVGVARGGKHKKSVERLFLCTS